MRARHRFALLLTTAAFGCSLIDTSGLTSAPGCPTCGDASLEASTDDAREPSDAPGSTLADASADPLSDGPLDGPLDGPPDAPRDAPSDRTSDVADGAPVSSGFCASLVPAPVFCDDFDTTPLSTNWLYGSSDPAGTVAARTDVVFSPPRAVLASVPTLSGSGYTYSQISHSMPPALRARVTFRALLTPGAMHPSVLIGTLKEGESGGQTFAGIGSSGGSAVFQYLDIEPNGSRTYPSISLGTWTDGVWQRFEILLVVTPPTATATVRMNNTTVVNQMQLLGVWSNGMAYFDLGCAGNLPITTESVWIDDVTFDTK